MSARQGLLIKQGGARAHKRPGKENSNGAGRVRTGSGEGPECVCVCVCPTPYVPQSSTEQPPVSGTLRDIGTSQAESTLSSFPVSLPPGHQRARARHGDAWSHQPECESEIGSLSCRGLRSRASDKRPRSPAVTHTTRNPRGAFVSVSLNFPFRDFFF